ncbi:hypothetical protein K435DRAFT_666271 [Dendrothele bispora CBS 962.96]|uniref:C2H2-type domain-containing protein n=1 Tax=Dendrothele bispora (strain CBS 962.96) TaxID=1314807 RepID=A0A4S8M0C0_DENBC|nr:hypothetical protein K435DRAFT_666271 [Dendrothele bispora CBS 962.96]
MDQQQQQQQQPSLFTCISCSIAFFSAEEQRLHYRSDHHRYNMKRRVAGLPPVSAAVFNEKVIERRTETAVMSSLKGSTCEVCNKTYSTENAYRSHVNSKKHKENEVKASLKLAQQLEKADVEAEENIALAESAANLPALDAAPESNLPSLPETTPISLNVDVDASQEEVEETIDAKIAASRSALSSSHCLFCPVNSDSLSLNLEHMSSAHSFFIPDADYLVDLPGLIQYLGEKIAVGNVCIYCNAKGREFRTLDAVRKHMLDKSHCKIAYDAQEDKLEISDYYDFSSSYPNALVRRSKKSKRSSKKTKKAEGEEGKAEEDGGWEDVSGDEDNSDVDEIVDESASEPEDSDTESDELSDNQITYGDSPYELVLPSGARIGHRAMRRYYAQSFHPLHGSRGNKNEDPNSGAALVRQLLTEKNSALVPRKGGFGSYGSGYDVVKARNAGEAKEAGRHVREFRDQQRREHFKTKVAFRHNHQKHFRDPLLQVSKPLFFITHRCPTHELRLVVIMIYSIVRSVSVLVLAIHKLCTLRPKS